MTIAGRQLAAGSGLGSGPDWRAALAEALDQALAGPHAVPQDRMGALAGPHGVPEHAMGALAPLDLDGQPPDLLLVYASAEFSSHYADILAEARARSAARHLVGCSASAVIAGDRELEDEPGIAVLALQLPDGASLRVLPLSPADLDPETPPGRWPDRLGLDARACTGLILLADPFSVNVTHLVADLERAFPGVPLVGGLATGAAGARHTWVFAEGRVLAGGAVLLGLAGSAAVQPVVSQGCEPLGACWTITDVDGYVIRTIGNRPAYEVLVETIQALEPGERRRVANNLLVGLAMDEYRDEFKRGDFLIRNLMGADPSSGAIAVGAEPSVGQTLQFQIRDARAADEELRHMLRAVATGPAARSAQPPDTPTSTQPAAVPTSDQPADTPGLDANRGGPDPGRSASSAPAAASSAAPPAAALLFACNGRGVGLFGTPDHDARMVREILGPLPLAGLFCNGEIGPVGGSTFLHGFTASLGLIVPR